jgi:ABC-type multidrug transport system fused ATPase/permease subunit
MLFSLYPGTEATASVDTTTDAFIQKMLRTSFCQTTLLTIAHRLHTIMDYDVVLVMDDGHAVEFGSPKVLLQDVNGFFTSLVEATGPESASALRNIADGLS